MRSARRRRDRRSGDVPGRAALIEGLAVKSGGHVDAVVANAGGGLAETRLQLNFFGAVATLEGLRPLLATSPAPRAVAVSSISPLRPSLPRIIDACISMDEPAAVAEAQRAYHAAEFARSSSELVPDAARVSLDLYGSAKRALHLWCRRKAPRAWANAGILLNVVALGFYDANCGLVLSDPGRRKAMARHGGDSGRGGLIGTLCPAASVAIPVVIR